MKKFIISTLALALSLILLFPTYFQAPKHTKAESLYLRVITEDTPFFASLTDSQPLFYLTYTYYVKILGYETNFVHVECFGNLYAGIDGFVPENYLYNDKLTVISPYPDLKLQTVKTAVLYLDSTLTQSSQYIFSERTLNYYGKLPTLNGENLYFVGYNGKLGYVKESDVLPFEIPLHPNELTFLTPPESQVPETPTPTVPTSNDSTTSTLRWVVIGCLILAGIIALIITISKRPKRVKVMPDYTDYYEENESE